MSEYTYEQFEEDWREDVRQSELTRSLGQVTCRARHDGPARDRCGAVV